LLVLLCLFAGIMVKRSPEPVGRFGGLISIVGIAIAAIGLVFSVLKVIDPGKVGVQILFGKVQNDVLESGLHIINPLVDVTVFNIQTQNYTMSAVHSEGEVQGDDAIRVLSSDGLEVTIDLSVLYKVNAAKGAFYYAKHWYGLR
jgi:regulator of protease activity HflC (stomatin/prohibitin superfamily)